MNTIGHTQSRRDELGEQLGAVLDEGSMTSKDAERLRGRMIFFEGFTFRKGCELLCKGNWQVLCWDWHEEAAGPEYETFTPVLAGARVQRASVEDREVVAHKLDYFQRWRV